MSKRSRGEVLGSRTSRRSKTKSKKIPGSAEKVGTQYTYPIGSKYHPRKTK